MLDRAWSRTQDPYQDHFYTCHQQQAPAGQLPHNGDAYRARPLLPALDAQRWHLPAPLGELAEASALEQLNPSGHQPLPLPLLALLARRGHTSAEAVATLLDPRPHRRPATTFPSWSKRWNA